MPAPCLYGQFFENDSVQSTQIEKIHIVTEYLTHIRFAIYNTFIRYFS